MAMRYEAEELIRPVLLATELHFSILYCFLLDLESLDLEHHVSSSFTKCSNHIFNGGNK
jgi:hypothetical protein